MDDFVGIRHGLTGCLGFTWVLELLGMRCTGEDVIELGIRVDVAWVLYVCCLWMDISVWGAVRDV